MRKYVLSSLALLAPAAVFAEGATVDTSAATGAITSVQTAMTTILTALGTAVVAVCLAGVAIWAIPRVLSSLKGAFTGGKGR